VAKQEQDREDLLREATALVERAEIAADSLPEPVTFGFRKDGCASFYFGADPAYHFNTAGELRRAYIDGRLLKAERGRLVSLERRRAEGEVQLMRHELAPAQAEELLQSMGRHLRRLQEVLDSGRYQLVGSVPEDADVCSRALAWLEQLQEPVTVAARPHAG